MPLAEPFLADMNCAQLANRLQSSPAETTRVSDVDRSSVLPGSPIEGIDEARGPKEFI